MQKKFEWRCWSDYEVYVVLTPLHQIRVHAFLEHWGIINFYVNPDLSATGMQVISYKYYVVVQSQSGAEASATILDRMVKLQEFSQTEKENEDKSKLETQVLFLLFLYSFYRQLCKQENILLQTMHNQMYLVFLSSNFKIHCGVCKKVCIKTRYHSEKDGKLDLCYNCFSEGKFSVISAGNS